MLANPAKDRHPLGAVLGERRRIRVEAGRQLHVAPEQLHHAAAAAAEVEHPAVGRQVAANQRLELVAARPPAGSHRPVARAVGVLKREREQGSGPVSVPHAPRILPLPLTGRNLEGRRRTASIDVYRKQRHRLNSASPHASKPDYLGIKMAWQKAILWKFW